MAHFRATIHGSRGESSRLGTKASGLITVTNGRDLGVQVCAIVDAQGDDCFEVFATSGSNNRASPRLIAVVRPSGVKLAKP